MEKLVGGSVTFVRIPHSGDKMRKNSIGIDALIPFAGINICLGVILTDLDEPG